MERETPTAEKSRTLRPWLDALGFRALDLGGKLWGRHFPEADCVLEVDCETGKFLYEKAGVVVSSATTANFSQPENFVVFECVCRLLAKGYKPNDLELEPQWKLGHTDKGGRADIWVRKAGRGGKKSSLLIIECKTAGREFEAAWRDTLADGAQLFSYFQQERETGFLCLYTSKLDDGGIKSDYRLINVRDNAEYLKTLKKPRKYADAENAKALFAVWRDTYQQEFATRGLFETDIEPYRPGKRKYSSYDLRELDHDSMQGKYHEFATILRQHNVSGHENAFDKLVNLFLAKLVDEKRNGADLRFHWKGVAYDTPYDLQDRLQLLYTTGMKEFLGEVVTYIDAATVSRAFGRFADDPDATKDTILDYFRQLKFYTNNDFAFLDVHNKRLFEKNFKILLKIVQMLEDMKLRTDKPNQFLGDLFEGFLDRGVKQSEGQFFTPLPIVRFIVSSLPLQELFRLADAPPRVVDYACGAGHFLNEYARQVKPFIELYPEAGRPGEHHAAIVGVEKEYRLSKVAKVSAFMYGEDDIRIVYADALAKNAAVPEGAFDVLVANPPYSVKGFLETLGEEDRARYELSRCVAPNQRPAFNAIECFFVERAAQLLKPRGVAGIILPSSILSNGNAAYVRAREILLETFDIVALAEFGSGTFGKTGTNTVVAFLRKKDAPPDPAAHFRNRAAAWFAGKHAGDAVFGDAAALDRYCARRRFDPADYRAFLDAARAEEVPGTLWNGNAFRALRDAFAKQKTPKKQTSEERARAEWEFVRDEEKERLYCFLLADSNPVPVLLVKMPAENKAAKAFLGYEWSARKGQEGIKYLGVPSSANSQGDEESEDDELARAKGVESIRTPLFDPQRLADEAAEKLNSLVRLNFREGLRGIPESLRPFARRVPLADLLDFDAAVFDKQFRTGVSERAEIISDYPLVRLGDVAPYATERIAYPKISPAAYVSTDNLLPNCGGVRPYEGTPMVDSVIAYRTGDILVSNIRPYLRKAWLADRDGGCSPDVLVFRSSDNHRLNADFLGILLTQDEFFTFMMEGAKGLKMPRGNKDAIPNYLIPLPPLDVQEAVVSECASLDEDCAVAKTTIRTAEAKIENLVEQAKGPTRKLASLCQKINPPKSEIGNSPREMRVSFVGMADISDKGFIERRTDRVLSEVATGSYTYFAEGDILLAKITPCMENGKCAIATDLTNGIGFGSSEFHVLRPSKECKVGYLFLWLNRAVIREAAAKRMTGASGHRRVPIEFYEELELPLPSLAEQEAIVENAHALEREIAAEKAVLAGAEERKRAILAAHGVIR